MKLITKRLELIPFTKKDTKLLYQLIKEDNKNISRWTTVPYPYKKNDMDEFYKKVQTDKKNIFLVIKNKKTKELMGVINPIKKEKNNSTRIGYWLGKQFRNKGYMTEALKKILDYCFRKMNVVRIEILAHENNKASQKVIRKGGLKYEGTLRMEAYNGLKQYGNSKIYSILKSEWKK